MFNRRSLPILGVIMSISGLACDRSKPSAPAGAAIQGSALAGSAMPARPPAAGSAAAPVTPPVVPTAPPAWPATAAEFETWLESSDPAAAHLRFDARVCASDLSPRVDAWLATFAPGDLGAREAISSLADLALRASTWPCEQRIPQWIKEGGGLGWHFANGYSNWAPSPINSMCDEGLTCKPADDVIAALVADGLLESEDLVPAAARPATPTSALYLLQRAGRAAQMFANPHGGAALWAHQAAALIIDLVPDVFIDVPEEPQCKGGRGCLDQAVLTGGGERIEASLPAQWGNDDAPDVTDPHRTLVEALNTLLAKLGKDRRLHALDVRSGRRFVVAAPAGVTAQTVATATR